MWVLRTSLSPITNRIFEKILGWVQIQVLICPKAQDALRQTIQGERYRRPGRHSGHKDEAKALSSLCRGLQDLAPKHAWP